MQPKRRDSRTTRPRCCRSTSPCPGMWQQMVCHSMHVCCWATTQHATKVCMVSRHFAFVRVRHRYKPKTSVHTCCGAPPMHRYHVSHVSSQNSERGERTLPVFSECRALSSMKPAAHPKGSAVNSDTSASWDAPSAASRPRLWEVALIGVWLSSTLLMMRGHLQAVLRDLVCPAPGWLPAPPLL